MFYNKAAGLRAHLFVGEEQSTYDYRCNNRQKLELFEVLPKLITLSSELGV